MLKCLESREATIFKVSAVTNNRQHSFYLGIQSSNLRISLSFFGLFRRSADGHLFSRVSFSSWCFILGDGIISKRWATSGCRARLVGRPVRCDLLIRSVCAQLPAPTTAYLPTSSLFLLLFILVPTHFNQFHSNHSVHTKAIHTRESKHNKFSKK